REQLMNGTDWIKIYAAYDFTFAPDGKLVVLPTFTLEEVQAFVEEAHDKGHKVSCHAFGGKGLHNCLAAGVDTIEHGVQLSDDDIQQFKTKGIYLIPTLYHYQLDREHDAKKYGGRTVAEVSEPNFRRAVAAGIKIGFGTGVGPFPHGTQIKEFEYMVKSGMTPAQVIPKNLGVKMLRRDFGKVALGAIASSALLRSPKGGNVTPAAEFPKTPGLTDCVGRFVVNTTYEDIPADFIELGKKSILDGLGLALAGRSEEHTSELQS